MAVREAEHAGSWYSDDGRSLARSLDGWLAQVPDDLGRGTGSGSLPVPGARAIMAPHAGYAYSGPAAAWAYRCLDLRGVERIFILHPSHHQALSTAALPTVTACRTPLAPDALPLDLDTIQRLSDAGGGLFRRMSRAVDEAEHSAEMQLPYLHRLLQQLLPGRAPAAYPRLVPIMVGAASTATEAALGRILAPYVADAANAFVVSSDFCHWGSRFQYTYYVADAPSPAVDARLLPNHTATDAEAALLHRHLSAGTHLRRTPAPPQPLIHESIAHVDRACMCAIATGAHADFVDVLRATGNTVCGRHPIGVFMAAVEEVRRTTRHDSDDYGTFHFVRYERSSDCSSVRDSSVSYVSAYALL